MKMLRNQISHSKSIELEMKKGRCLQRKHEFPEKIPGCLFDCFRTPLDTKILFLLLNKIFTLWVIVEKASLSLISNLLR